MVLKICDFEVLKMGQNLHANMEQSQSHIYIVSKKVCSIVMVHVIINPALYIYIN